jgi:hypothetical protein
VSEIGEKSRNGAENDGFVIDEIYSHPPDLLYPQEGYTFVATTVPRTSTA